MPVITVTFNDAGVRADLERLIRALDEETQDVMVRAADRTALPIARRAAKSPYRGFLRSVATRNGAMIRVVGPRVRVRTAGWLEFGGSIEGKKSRVGWSTYSSLKDRKVRRRAVKSGPGLMTFRVDGRWVSVRVVRRPFNERGRYVGAALRNPGVVKQVERDIVRGMDGVFRKYLAPEAKVD